MNLFQGEFQMSQTKQNSFFRNIVDGIIESRARQASRYVNGALLMLDDEANRPCSYWP